MKLTPAYISSSVEDSTSARVLTFRSKSITHIDDISFCVNLAKLDLSENELRSGESLSGLKYCKSVSWISVAKNKLVDITQLTNLKNLQVLNASYNDLSDLPWDSLVELKALKALILNNNKFTVFPVSSAHLPSSLDTLVLSHNEISELPTKMLRSVPYLSKLSCSHARLHAVPDLSHCQELKELRLASNKIISLAQIEKSVPLSLEILDLGHNLITKRSELDRLFHFKKLTSLNIRGNLSPEDDEAFLQTARKQLPALRNFNGRSLEEKKRSKVTEFRLKPERQNRNTKVKFSDE